MFKTDQVLVQLNRLMHLTRLDAFEGLNEIQSEELSNLSSEIGSTEIILGGHYQYSYCFENTEDASPYSKLRRDLNLIGHNRRGSSYQLLTTFDEVLYKMNAPEFTQTQVNGVVYDAIRCLAEAGLHPLASAVGSLFTVYPLPSGVEQHKDLNKWGATFANTPTVENFISLHERMEKENHISEQFVPFYENNFSPLHSKIAAVLWGIDSATLLYHVAASLCSETFLKGLAKELEKESDTLTDVPKFFKSIYNEVVVLSESHCNEYVVDLRTLLFINVIEAFMETVDEK